MKTASRILGTAFFYVGFEVQDAPLYGAERRGAPVFAYVRADRKAINERGVIRRPDLVVVADDTLVPVPVAGVARGVTGDTVLLINSSVKAEDWKKRLNLTCRVVTLPVVEMVGLSEVRFAGAVCAGAAAGLTGVIPAASLERAMETELGHLGPRTVRKNIDMALDAYGRMADLAGCVKEGGPVAAEGYEDPGWVDLPLETAGVSAPAIHAPLTSELMKTGLWRTARPVIDYDLCNRCWWLCGTFCPEGAISVNEEGFPEIDYEHCKGCMICLAQCPPHAISAVPERREEGEKK